MDYIRSWMECASICIEWMVMDGPYILSVTIESQSINKLQTFGES